MDWIENIENKHDSFEKKQLLIDLCKSYHMNDYNLETNYKIIQIFLKNFMIYRSLFRKKDVRIDSFVRSCVQYCTLYEIKTTHIDYLLYLLIKLSLAIINSEYFSIKNCLDLFNIYLNENILSEGILKNAYEHDSLQYHVIQLDQIMQLMKLFKHFGFFRYFHHKLLSCFEFLIPYILNQKKHYLFINSVFENDRSNPNWGTLWDIDEAINLFNKYQNFHVKIKEIYDQSINKLL